MRVAEFDFLTESLDAWPLGNIIPSGLCSSGHMLQASFRFFSCFLPCSSSTWIRKQKTLTTNVWKDDVHTELGKLTAMS